jgi:hypothetical protein
MCPDNQFCFAAHKRMGLDICEKVFVSSSYETFFCGVAMKLL